MNEGWKSMYGIVGGLGYLLLTSYKGRTQTNKYCVCMNFKITNSNDTMWLDFPTISFKCMKPFPH